jgi:hypothetical protein
MARVPVLALIALTLLIVASCASPPSETDNRNMPATGAGSPPAAAPAPAAPPPPAPATENEATATGSIKVESTPAGAEVLLIMEAVGGAGPPEPRGTTPTTITDLAPGTYTVHLEKPGYKFFQKGVQVKPGKTSTVTATLKR